jgi:hypothetical protein
MTATTPLSWPIGRPRTQRPTVSQFATTGPRALKHLAQQVHLLGGKHLVVSSNLPVTRYTEEPKWSAKVPTDGGVAVYFELEGEEVCFACDRWYYVEENVRAIGKTLEALRGINRWGTDDMVRASFQGFAALPETTGRPWWEVLGVDPDAARPVIDAAYRRKLKQTHPDIGGDRELFDEVQEAYRVATDGVIAR